MDHPEHLEHLEELFVVHLHREFLFAFLPLNAQDHVFDLIIILCFRPTLLFDLWFTLQHCATRLTR